MALLLKNTTSLGLQARQQAPAAFPSMATRSHSTASRAVSTVGPAATRSLLEPSARIRPPRPLRRVVKVAAASGDGTSPSNGKPVVVITGASSGLGLAAATALAKAGQFHVVMAVRDYSKTVAAAKRNNIPKDNFTIMHLDLASLDSVKDFVKNFRREGFSLDVLVANAAVYLPTAKVPTFTADGFEMSVGTNHLGHFLLCNLLLEDLKKSTWPQRRMIIVGSITGNANTLAGKIPPQANLGDMAGLVSGLGPNSPMIDGLEFDGAKAYKDSKVCNMLTMREFHKRFHEETGITFASLYPGCIAETGLFRNHVPLFRTLFPLFQKNITKGYVSEEEAGRRLSAVVSDPSYKQSCAYWSWSNTSGAFENQVSDEVSDWAKGEKLWETSAKLVGLA